MRLSRSVALAALLALASTPAGAQETPISSAAEAWEVGEIEQAGALYEQALAGGGLAPSDTLTAYVRIGVWRAATKKNDAALSAFRNAAIIDPQFAYPGEAGPSAKPIYEKARAEAAGKGKLEVVVEVPAEVKTGAPFTVGASVPEGLVLLFETMSLQVEDRPGHVVHRAEMGAETEVRFEVPGAVAPAAASLTVRVAAVDPQKNEWARTTRTIKVAAAAAPAPVTVLFPEKKKGKSKGFWSSPWPYVVGGAVVVAASSIAIGVAAGSRSNVVSVNAPTWQAATFSP